MKKSLFLLALGLSTLNSQPSTLNPQLFTITAYCPCKICCGPHAAGLTLWSKQRTARSGNQTYSTGRTASGKPAVAGVTVAGPRALPFGTRLTIPGVGGRIIQDRLAKRFDSRLDVFFATHAEAKRFGIKKLNVTISNH